jgi:hypothetical protein
MPLALGSKFCLHLLASASVKHFFFKKKAKAGALLFRRERADYRTSKPDRPGRKQRNKRFRKNLELFAFGFFLVGLSQEECGMGFCSIYSEFGKDQELKKCLVL